MKMKTKRLVLIAALLQLLAFTSLAANKVTVDWDKTVDFSKFKTYAWKVGTPSKDPLMDRRIVDAINQQMAMKGFLKVDVESMPDLIVVYHAAVEYETQLNTVGMGYGWGYYGGSTTTYVEKIPVGTLLVDMGDENGKKLVWRGQGSSTLSDKPEKIDKKIYQVVEKMFKKFPPEVK